MRRPVGLATVGLLAALTAAHAKECPPNSHFIGSEKQGSRTTIHCKCDDGYELRDNVCVASGSASIVIESLSPGLDAPALLPGTGQPDYQRRLAEFESRKADVYRRVTELTRLRNECRAQLPACSTTGKLYSRDEAIRRRDLQYFTWGEASYYIPWKDVLTDVPPEITDIGTWGGIKVFGYGGDKLWIWIKDKAMNFGSTPPGGSGEAKRGWHKAYSDNQGFVP